MSLHRAMRKVQEREAAIALGRERRAMETGDWPPWRVQAGEACPKPHPEMTGWVRETHTVWHNGVFAVLIRDVECPGIGTIQHAAIRNVSNSDIPWRDKQRIKNEVFGDYRVAVEVFPPTDQLVDGADMYHLWVYPSGYRLAFGIHA